MTLASLTSLSYSEGPLIHTPTRHASHLSSKSVPSVVAQKVSRLEYQAESSLA